MKKSFYLLLSFIAFSSPIFSAADTFCQEPHLQNSIEILRDQERAAYSFVEFKKDALENSETKLSHQKMKITAATAIAGAGLGLAATMGLGKLGALIIYTLHGKVDNPLNVLAGGVVGGLTGMIAGTIGTPIFFSLSTRGSLKKLKQANKNATGPTEEVMTTSSTEEIEKKVLEIEQNFRQTQRLIQSNLEEHFSEPAQSACFTLGWSEYRHKQALVNTQLTSMHLYEKEAKYAKKLAVILETFCETMKTN